MYNNSNVKFIMRMKGFLLLPYVTMQRSHKIFRRVSHLSISSDIHHIQEKCIKSYSSADSKDNVRVNSTEEHDFSDRLIKWAIQNNISYLAFSKLLKILSEYRFKSLPKNSRDLFLAKEERIKVSAVPPGTYIHYGLEKNLKNLISELINKNLLKETEVGISIFIDHLPLTKLRKSGLWVILGSLEGFQNNIFLVGAYYGFSRPNNSNLFLSNFVEEAKNLCINGFKINGATYKLKISRLICDAPAKYFVLNIKSFLSYSSCTKCNAVGQSKNCHIYFPAQGAARTDKDFERKEIYQGEKTKLLEIPDFGVVSKVTIDYMHLVCLGVVMKLISIWITDQKHWISMTSASELMKKLTHTFPYEFRKKPKAFKIIGRWSGNELRQFLLYYGPVILKGNLEKENYEHFLLLHVACRLLCNKATAKNIEIGGKLLNSFVEDYKKIYNRQQITHNIHGLYHLADECKFHGTLDNFSAFPFEKFLIKLRNRMEKCKKKMIPQTMLTESYDAVFTKTLTKLTGNDFKLGKKLKTSVSDNFKDYSQYEKLLWKNFEINPSTEGDKYVLLKNNKMIEVVSVLEKREESKKTHFIAGREFSSVCNFHSEPFNSLQLDMYTIGEVSDTLNIWPINMIYKKCMKIFDASGKTVMVALLNENF